MIFANKIREVCSQRGFELVSVLDVEAAERTLREHQESLDSWVDSNYCAELEYMRKRRGRNFLLSDFLPGAKSVIVLAVPYSAKTPDPLPEGHARVARYAWGRDYHRVIKKYLKRVMGDLQQDTSDFGYRIFSDAVPLLERSLGFEGKLGFFVVTQC